LTEKRFGELLKKQLLASHGEGFIFGDSISLLQVSSNNFDKHLYEKAGKMNQEELDFAGKLNILENIYWWFRNPEMSGFYIQGWKRQKFYPDFIAKTKNENYIVIEYKGEHLIGLEDSDYKEGIGKEWDKLNGEDYYFRWAEKNNIDSIIGEISKM